MVGLVRLVKAEITTSRLAFGTSRLHHIEKSARQPLLALAIELGFIHFDTAPAYGDGLAERELGAFARGRRDRIVIATKYGIPPNPVLEAWPALSVPLRGARAILRKAGLWKDRLPPLSATGLRASTEQSLRRLRTDWIDIVLLHEPSAERLTSPDEILAELDDLRRRGLIRAYGIAGAWTGIASTLGTAPGLAQVIQTSEAEWPLQSPPDIAYQAMSAGPQHRLARSLQTADAGERLRAALRRRPHGVVLVSTTKSQNLRQLARVEEAEPR